MASSWSFVRTGSLLWGCSQDLLFRSSFRKRHKRVLRCRSVVVHFPGLEEGPFRLLTPVFRFWNIFAWVILFVCFVFVSHCSRHFILFFKKFIEV